MEKRCTKCKRKKLVSEFHKNARQKDGFQVWCKDCVKTHQNQKRSQNRELYRAYQRDWFDKNPGYFLRYSREKVRKVHGTHITWNED